MQKYLVLKDLSSFIMHLLYLIILSTNSKLSGNISRSILLLALLLAWSDLLVAIT